MMNGVPSQGLENPETPSHTSKAKVQFNLVLVLREVSLSLITKKINFL